MEHGFYTFSSNQQQELGDNLNGLCQRTLREMVIFMDNAILTMAAIEKTANDFKQRLLVMRGRDDIQNLYAGHHATREEESAAAAAQPSGQASTVNDEQRPGQTDLPHKLRLCFNGSLKSTIYTNKPLLAQSKDGGGIEIAICSGDDGQIVTSGRFASLTVEIVALERDHSCKREWTQDDFERQIRKSRDGQGSVLDGECFVKLVNGRASLGNIRFKESSNGTRSREFVLAARVCKNETIGGSRVEEAFMHPPFVVLVERSKGNEKSPLPKLGDKIYVLSGIARGGPYARRLEKVKIHTVQDFLKALNRDQYKLEKILEIKSQASWEATVKHARKCDLKDRHDLKSYKVETDNVYLFFNCVDDLVGAEFGSRYVAKDKFDALQKVLVDTQLKQAYSRLDDIAVGYAMESDHPVKISTNGYVAGSTSTPTLSLVTSPTNDLCYQEMFQAMCKSTEAAEHYSSPYGTGVDTRDLPLGDAVGNVAEQSSSELFRPLGDAVGNVAEQSSLELFRPVQCNVHANQDVGQNSGVRGIEDIGNAPYHGGLGGVPDHLQGIAAGPNTASVDITHMGNLEETLTTTVHESQQANDLPDSSSGGTFAQDDSPIFSPEVQGPSDFLSDMDIYVDVDPWPKDG